MTVPSLLAVLKGTNWDKNIDDSLSHGSTESEIETAVHRVAVWSNQLEILDSGNPALSFVREMQASIQSSGLLIGMCLYKSSAASSRTLVETCLYYSFFRTHLTELATLVNDPKYYVSKSDIVEYHKVHTAGFRAFQSAIGLVAKLEAWYSKVSAIVHGQIPGVWNAQTALADINFKEVTHKLALSTMLEAEQIVHDILLCTVARELWVGFAPDAKSYLLKGLSGQVKTALKLDSK